jgi:hypothetical protein
MVPLLVSLAAFLLIHRRETTCSGGSDRCIPPRRILGSRFGLRQFGFRHTESGLSGRVETVGIPRSSPYSGFVDFFALRRQLYQ